MSGRTVLGIILLLAIVLSLTVFSQARTGNRLILATTTSTDNSGLLDVLIPPFEERFDVRVDVVAVGTGKAIALARNGDADLILVHAREAEDKFLAEGYGVNRRDVMYNDFIILGPGSDPAGVRDTKSAVEAFQAIARAKVPFISRGDDSGTNKKELAIWQKAGINPMGQWYQAVGQGMGASLTIADEKGAYILADRGTYLAYKDKIDLEILLEGDPILFNPYGIIAVNPAKYSHVNYLMAMAFIGWVTSQEGQEIIRNYKKFGEVLFHPSAIK